MAENIDYYIYKVNYSTAHTYREHIEKVLTTTNLYREDGTEKIRATVVNDIKKK